ncbi:hypothetical protein [Streptomyces reniochalinae]|uniref:META domain-containing protein n=1 Tax=Streptomyces reniochalinae TaxID=2250578 RepID=A0A367F4R0_9ACTN|nr:hypothetical protein [Streptomyces reniochalinae]RCG25271.1 hypothetical protein DQ392_01890 [Streptomyces reniochalinae]
MGFKRAKVIGGAAVLAVIAAAGSVTTVYATEDGASPADGSVGEKAGTPEKIDSHVVDKDDSHIRIELKDKRQVSLTYAKDKGLVERHRPAEGGTWSSPKTIYKTKAESCQGIDARAHGDTVAVTANWGLYCSDGEPPQESVAAMGAGELTEWDTAESENSDGWPPAQIYDGGDRAEFVAKGPHSTTTLPWKKGSGFGDEATVYEPIPGRFVGSWRAEDGSHRVTFQQAAAGKPATGTIETLTGQRCLGSGVVTKKSADGVELGNFTIKEGKQAKNCPPEVFEHFYQVETADGDMQLMELGKPPKPVATYKRTGD